MKTSQGGERERERVIGVCGEGTEATAASIQEPMTKARPVPYLSAPGSGSQI